MGGVDLLKQDNNPSHLPEPTNRTLTIEESGTYYVRVSNASGCFNVSDEETFAFTGIDEDVSPDFKVYPLSADETVTFTHKAGEDVQVELLDLTGKSLGTFFDNGNIEIDLHLISFIIAIVSIALLAMNAGLVE